ncbi:MAG: hypothetical protein MJY86_01385 [Bacteroidales bacterium]|nr:hypothetical protein [Bacteroidales bacterium]
MDISYDRNGNITALTHDGLAGLDLQYNLLNLTKRISSGGTTLADYHYLADGTRAAAERGDRTGVQYRGSLPHEMGHALGLKDSFPNILGGIMDYPPASNLSPNEVDTIWNKMFWK